MINIMITTMKPPMMNQINTGVPVTGSGEGEVPGEVVNIEAGPVIERPPAVGFSATDR
jgi:hypothetical protein